MLEEKINKLGKNYIINGNIDGYKFVKVYTPLEWDLTSFDDEIEIERDENTPKVTAFATENENKSFSDIIDCIQQVFQYNNDKVLKNELFSSFQEKLKAIFDEKDLETLKTLSFVFGEKPKRPYIKKKSVRNEPDKEINKIDNRDLLVEKINLTEVELDSDITKISK